MAASHQFLISMHGEVPRYRDVIVVGAGIIGAACAHALAGAGLSVAVLDAGPAAAGTTGQGEGNLLVSDKEPGPELALMRRSLELWDNLPDRLCEQLPNGFPAIEYERKGGLVVATTGEGAGPLRQFAAKQAAAGVSAETIDRDHALALEPELNPEVTAAVYYPEDAQVQPVIATEALLAAARHLGAITVGGVRVTGPLGGPGRVEGVRTTVGECRAGLVLLACGPWSGEVAAAFGSPLPVRPRRGVVLVTAPMPQRIFHKVYDTGYVAVVGSDDAGLQTSAVIESTAGGTVLVGSSRRRCGFDRSLDLEAIRSIASKAVRVFPFLSGVSVIRVYGGFRPFLPDHLPVIGADAQTEGLWHATGHEGGGIGLALGTAELISDLITGTRPAVDPRPFAPARLAQSQLGVGG